MATLASILLRHAGGEHASTADQDCPACVRHLPGLHNQLSHGKGHHMPGTGGSGHGAKGGGESSPPPLTDAEYAAHTAEIEQKVGEALRAGKSTDRQHAIDVDRGIWSPERAKIHGAIVEQLYEKARNVPSEGKAIVAGGLGGAGKSTVLGKHAGVDTSKYLTLNPDDMKEEIVNRGLAPEVDGLSPMEAAALIHEESSHITNLLAKRAYADKKNVIWDITMASRGSTQRRVHEMRAAGYDDVSAVFVDIPVETSVARALARHRRGMEQYRNGVGFGGRYVPPSIIRKNAVSGASSANRATFDALRTDFGHWSLYDNTGTAPRLVSTSKGGD
jgi:predicted ABC-type ATPase